MINRLSIKRLLNKNQPEMNANKVPKVKLNDGNLMPIIGLGTWQSPASRVYSAVKEALSAGYRHFDCALVYGNESQVGKALNESIKEGKVKREDLFIVSKLWSTHFKKDRVQNCLRKSLANLGLDFLNLYLIHWPQSLQQVDDTPFPMDADGNVMFANVDYLEAWQGMEECLKLGLTKSIGVSNFNSLQIDLLLKVAQIKPVINQVECHPYLAQKKLLHFCTQRGITLTAYSPLANPGSKELTVNKVKNLLEDPKVKELAVKYKKGAGQILIKFQAQCGVIVIPKSVTKDRIISNIQIFDFNLTDGEIQELESLDCGYRTCDLKSLGAHKHHNYPFGSDVEF